MIHFKLAVHELSDLEKCDHIDNTTQGIIHTPYYIYDQEKNCDNGKIFEIIKEELNLDPYDYVYTSLLTFGGAMTWKGTNLTFHTENIVVEDVNYGNFGFYDIATTLQNRGDNDWFRFNKNDIDQYGYPLLSLCNEDGKIFLTEIIDNVPVPDFSEINLAVELLNFKAKFLTMDRSGEWYVYADKPSYLCNGWYLPNKNSTLLHYVFTSKETSEEVSKNSLYELYDSGEWVNVKQ